MVIHHHYKGFALNFEILISIRISNTLYATNKTFPLMCNSNSTVSRENGLRNSIVFSSDQRQGIEFMAS